jgi:hypothetical protein
MMHPATHVQDTLVQIISAIAFDLRIVKRLLNPSENE